MDAIELLRAVSTAKELEARANVKIRETNDPEEIRKLLIRMRTAYEVVAEKIPAGNGPSIDRLRGLVRERTEAFKGVEDLPDELMLAFSDFIKFSPWY